VGFDLAISGVFELIIYSLIFILFIVVAFNKRGNAAILLEYFFFKGYLSF
tara:strand:- start:5918 stop:6067 length:150 start_codon:yes stop_codon:yes gene_type:complete